MEKNYFLPSNFVYCTSKYKCATSSCECIAHQLFDVVALYLHSEKTK